MKYKYSTPALEELVSTLTELNCEIDDGRCTVMEVEQDELGFYSMTPKGTRMNVRWIKKTGWACVYVLWANKETKCFDASPCESFWLRLDRPGCRTLVLSDLNGHESVASLLGAARASLAKFKDRDNEAERKRLELEVKFASIQTQYGQEAEAFARRLKGHDWYSDYSDDPSVSQRGRNNRQALEKIRQSMGDTGVTLWEMFKP